jgi:hypothetical protein
VSRPLASEAGAKALRAELASYLQHVSDSLATLTATSVTRIKKVSDGHRGGAALTLTGASGAS